VGIDSVGKLGQVLLRNLRMGNGRPSGNKSRESRPGVWAGGGRRATTMATEIESGCGFLLRSRGDTLQQLVVGAFH